MAHIYVASPSGLICRRCLLGLTHARSECVGVDESVQFQSTRYVIHACSPYELHAYFATRSFASIAARGATPRWRKRVAAARPCARLLASSLCVRGGGVVVVDRKSVV